MKSSCPPLPRRDSYKAASQGVALLPHAQRLLADWEDVRERLEQQFTLQRGHVTIAAMPSFAGNVLPRVLKRFRDPYPLISLAGRPPPLDHTELWRAARRNRLGWFRRWGPIQAGSLRHAFADPGHARFNGVGVNRVDDHVGTLESR
jgi:hypothetical protein